MTSLQKLLNLSQALVKYGALAATAVAQVQSEVGASGGDPAIQSSKKQLAVAYVIAAAHAGESLAIPQVQEIAALVDFTASISKSLGVWGKTPDPAATIVVPAR